MLELTEVCWTFNRLFNSHHLPECNRDGFVNYYFKFNVRESAGQLRPISRPSGQGVFVGELQQVPVILVNEGTEPIDEVVVVAND